MSGCVHSFQTSDTRNPLEWQKEKMELIQTKDEEKKLAVQEARVSGCVYLALIFSHHLPVANQKVA